MVSNMSSMKIIIANMVPYMSAKFVATVTPIP